MQTQDAVEGLHNFLKYSQLSHVFRWKYKYVTTSWVLKPLPKCFTTLTVQSSVKAALFVL